MSDSVTTSTRRAAPALEGRTIGVLEARMTDTIATLFEREGATVVRAPALAEAVVDATAEIKAWIETLVEDRYDIVVFLTGVGVTRLLDEIERLGHLDAVRAALGRTTVVARGPKPSAALGRRRIGVSVAVAEPWTTQAVVDTVRSLPLAGKRVALVHFGERSSALADAIQEGGAILDELCIYEWRLPDDLGPLDKLVGLTIDGRVDAVVFTSQVQVRHFLEVAARSEREAPLIEALNAWTVTASIGPTCSAALVARGITPRIEPTRPKLGPLVERVVQYLAVEGSARCPLTPWTRPGPRSTTEPQGHTPTLAACFLHFDVSLHALGAARRPRRLHRGRRWRSGRPRRRMVVAIPILSGSLLRVPLGLLSDRFGGKRVGTIMLICLYGPLTLGWLSGDSLNDLMAIGALLGVAGASFAVALPLASRWYPPEKQGLAMGIAAAGNSGTVVDQPDRAAPRRLDRLAGRHGGRDDPADDRARRVRAAGEGEPAARRPAAHGAVPARAAASATCGRSACSTR